MGDEPTLPRLPSFNESGHASHLRKDRKRALRHRPSLLSNSSDPAIFSSDDVEDPSLDNYDGANHHRRRKRRYVGSWYQQQPASSDSSFSEEPRKLPKAKRTLQRHFDSGVWMGSDGTESEDMSIPDVPRALPQFIRPAVAVRRASISKEEERAREVIRLCLEASREDVNLTSMGLDSLSNATILPLADLLYTPIVANGVPFEQRDPCLRLFLASNQLTRLPGAIFNLEHLTCLSLRNNNLRELPPAIARLKSLDSLNVSQNHLTHLPAELLGMLSPKGRLRHLFTHPNPFHQPKPDERDPLTAVAIPADDALLQVMDHSDERLYGLFFCRSPVQYSDSMGRVWSQYKLPMTAQDSDSVELERGESSPPRFLSSSQQSEESRRSGRGSKVPSLVEVALRTLAKTPELAGLGAVLPSEGFGHLRRVLDQAADQQEYGGLVCGCGRAMVMPTTAWYEWVRIFKGRRVSDEDVELVPLSNAADEQLIPFLRRGCSWACLPGKYESVRWVQDM